MTKDEALKMAIKTAKTAIKEWQKLVDDLDGKAWRKINELEEKLEDCKEAVEQPLTRDWKVTIDERIAKDDEFKQALEQPAQEPVAWNEEEFNAIAYAYRAFPSSEVKMVSEKYKALVDYVLSIANPAPSWQGLSDDDIHNYADHNFAFASEHFDEIFKFARAIEQALKEKNG